MVYLIEIIGHTKASSIVIAEDDGLFYMFCGMFHADEALYANNLSVVQEGSKKQETLG